MVNEYTFGGFVTKVEADLDHSGERLSDVIFPYRAPVPIVYGNGEDVCEVDLDAASIC